MRFVPFVAVLLALVLLAPAVAAEAQPPSASDSPIIMPGDPPDLLLFYTGDVIGYLNPCG